MTQTSTFAVIEPDGALSFEQGTLPYRAWSRVDPHHDDAEGFTVAHARPYEVGMRAYVGAVSALQPEKYPRNFVASRVAEILAAEFGGRLTVDLYGAVALCGWEMDEAGDVEAVALTPKQREQVAEAHALVTRPVNPVWNDYTDHEDYVPDPE